MKRYVLKKKYKSALIMIAITIILVAISVIAINDYLDTSENIWNGTLDSQIIDNGGDE